MILNSSIVELNSTFRKQGPKYHVKGVITIHPVQLNNLIKLPLNYSEACYVHDSSIHN